MKIKHLIERGYFPKELPPPFSTITLASKYTKLMGCLDQSNKTTKLDNFYIHKNTVSKRKLSIPHPLSFIFLANEIVNGWSIFEGIFKENEQSMSSPVLCSDIIDRSIGRKSKSVSDLINHRLSISYNYKIELKLDISNFYHRIYTHSIPWALLTKEISKQMLSKKIAKNATYDLGDKLDTLIRKCQGNQTIGIPVGPDTSMIIAELILARIDHSLSNEIPEISFCRYYDDYFVYTDSIDDANKILKKIESLLGNYNLEINESKVSIKAFPFKYIDRFSIEIPRFKFGSQFEKSIKLYFNLIWELAEENPDKQTQIFKYALIILNREEFFNAHIQRKEQWSIFEDLLLKTLLLAPELSDLIFYLYLKVERSFIDKEKLENVIQKILDSHINSNDSFEIAWALWFCKVFNLKITEKEAKGILGLSDSITRLILLDIINSIPQSFNLTSEIEELSEKIDNEGIDGENWLLNYEGTYKGWLNLPNVAQNDLYQKLRSHKISFYDPDIIIKDSEYILNKKSNLLSNDEKTEIRMRSENAKGKIYNMLITSLEDKIEPPLWYTPQEIAEEIITRNKKFIELEDRLNLEYLNDKIADTETDDNELIQRHFDNLIKNIDLLNYSSLQSIF